MSLLSLSLCIAMVVFEYFLRALTEYRVRAVAYGDEGKNGALPDDETWLLGYALFLWITIILIRPAWSSRYS